MRLLWLAVFAASCSGTRLVVLRPQRVPVAEPRLHVKTAIDGAADPLPLRGDGVTFAGVASTLGDTIAAAGAMWADKHIAERPGGWELRVDLLQAHAEESNGRVTVELGTRVTLSATLGGQYLAQTHGYCKQTDVLASDPTAAVYACMESMAHDLSGWLEGVSP